MTTPTTPAQAATTLLAQLANGQPPGYAKLVATLASLPPALVALADIIQKEPSRAVADIVMTTVRPNMVFRPGFSFQNAAAPRGNRTQEEILRNMATGSGEYAFDLPKLELNQFAAALFKAIAVNHPATKLNERDLFHGHIIPNEAARDLVIVFHAKEYPSEEFGLGKWTMYRDFSLLTGGVTDFDTASAVMHERNFVWTLRTNQIFLLADPQRAATPDLGFAMLMVDKHGAAPSTTLAKQAGTVQECNFGTELFVANYFPTHLKGGDDQEAFFAPVGRWGVLARLETDFPNIPAAEVARIYTTNDDSLQRTVPLLRAWK